jgi:diguanylate cyclase (GGDEF)-like protein
MTSIEQPASSARKRFRALLSRLYDWYQENRQATIDMLVLIVLSVLTYLFISRMDLMDRFYVFTREHEALELDELILSLGVISSLYVSVFAMRRWAEATKRLRESNTDSLTGLFSRRRGQEVLEDEFVRSNRYRRDISVIMLDIDNFKTINDTHGHLAGDRVLKTVANVAGEIVRRVDDVIRWGGEEFIVLLPDTGLEAALQVAERLREAIARTPIQMTPR